VPRQGGGRVSKGSRAGEHARTFMGHPSLNKCWGNENKSDNVRK
jgi:hypothetical protein